MRLLFETPRAQKALGDRQKLSRDERLAVCLLPGGTYSEVVEVPSPKRRGFLVQSARAARCRFRRGRRGKHGSRRAVCSF